MTDEDDQNAPARAPGSPATPVRPRAATRLRALHSSVELPSLLGAPGAAWFRPMSHNRKPAPVERLPTAIRPRLQARGPSVSTTNVSIAATCSGSCPFNGRGCFAEGGFTRFTVRRLDVAARGLTADEFIAEEVRPIELAFRGKRIPQDDTRGGRDLRLHVGGDVCSALEARLLARAAGRWSDRGGGTVWSFAHAWCEVSRDVWGPLSVLASVKRPEDIEAARTSGYAAAIAVDRIPFDRALSLPGSSAKIVPCPAETRGPTCMERRLCVDGNKLFHKNVAFAFEAHGPMTRRAREALAVATGERDTQLSHDSAAARGGKRSTKSRRAA